MRSIDNCKCKEGAAGCNKAIMQQEYDELNELLLSAISKNAVNKIQKASLLTEEVELMANTSTEEG